MTMQLVELYYFNINFVHLYNLYEFIVLLFMRRLCRYSPDDSTNRNCTSSAISQRRRDVAANWTAFREIGSFSQNFVKFGKIPLYFLSLLSYF